MFECDGCGGLDFVMDVVELLGGLGGLGGVGKVLKKKEWHCDGEDFICSSRSCFKWEQRPVCMKQRGGNVLRVSPFHLLDGSNFRVGSHGAMIGSRDVRNNGHSWNKT